MHLDKKPPTIETIIKSPHNEITANGIIHPFFYHHKNAKSLDGKFYKLQSKVLSFTEVQKSSGIYCFILTFV